MADPYQTLGVAKNASADDIQRAYRRLAKETHPDLHPGDTKAEVRFKEITAAYEILGDPEKRKKFDQGEIDETGAERQQQRSYRHYAESDPGFRYSTWSGGSDFGDFSDIFKEAFEDRARRHPARGQDVQYSLSVTLIEAANGTSKRVSMPDGKTLDINVPAGIRDGQSLRLKGQGMSGQKGAPPGDALVEIHVSPHPDFERDGDNIHSILPITLSEAINGAKVTAPTVEGPVALTIPKHADSGRLLRLRGKGVLNGRTGQRGDHLVELRIVMPKAQDQELSDFIADWEARHPYDPRKQGG